jgi:HPt (histidine-containing phosphotransfer) domain-containing protein
MADAAEPPQPERALRPPPTLQPPSARPLVFDATVLAALPMVVDGSEPEFEQFVLEQFVQGSTESLLRIQQAVAQGHQRDALRVLHTLKSTSAQVGALELAGRADELELAMRGGQSLDAQGIVELSAAHRHALQAIATHRRGESAVTAVAS